MARNVFGFGPMGVAPDLAPQDPKSTADALASRHQVPANVLLALQEAGSADLDRDAADLAATLKSGATLDQALGAKIGDPARASAVLNRAYDIADELYPRPEAKREPSMLRDTAAGAGGALVRGVGYAADFGARLAGDFLGAPDAGAIAGQIVGDPIKQAGDAVSGLVSPEAREAAQKVLPTGDLLDPSTWAAPEEITIRGAIQIAAEGLGSMAPVVLAGLVAGPGGAAAAGGAMSGGAGRETAAQTIDGLWEPDEAGNRPLEQSEVFQGLVAQGMTPQAAYRTIRDRAAKIGGDLSAVVGGIGGAATQKLVGGIAGGKYAASRAVRGILASATEEGIQEGIEGVAARKGAQDASGVDMSLTENFISDAAAGALGGGPFGALAGLSRPQNPSGDGSSGGQAAAPTPPPPGGGVAADQIDPVGAAPAPTGPLSRAAAAAPDLTPVPEAPEQPPKFPDQKPGKPVRVSDPQGRIWDAVFQRETPEGGAVLRIAGEEITLDAVEFDGAVLQARLADEQAKMEAKGKTLPEKAPTATRDDLARPPMQPGGLAAQAQAGIAPPAPPYAPEPAPKPGPVKFPTPAPQPTKPDVVNSADDLAQGLGNMGKGIADGLYDMLFAAYEKGSLKDASGAADPILKVAKRVRDAGGVLTRETFKPFAQEVAAVMERPPADRAKLMNDIVKTYAGVKPDAAQTQTETTGAAVTAQPDATGGAGDAGGIPGVQPVAGQGDAQPSVERGMGEERQPGSAPDGEAGAGDVAQPVDQAALTGEATPAFALTDRVKATMRDLMAESERLMPRPDKSGATAIGSDDARQAQRSGAIDLFLRSLRQGKPPEEAAKDAKAGIRKIIERHNARRPDTNWKVAEGEYDSAIDAMAEKVRAAASEPAPALGETEGQPPTDPDGGSRDASNEVPEEGGQGAEPAGGVRTGDEGGRAEDPQTGSERDGGPDTDSGAAEAGDGDGTGVAPDQLTDPVTAAAAEADPDPTPAQAEAGNYKKGHIAWNGLDLTIETAKGAERRGTSADGTEWSVTMPAHYGYIRRTLAADDEQMDFYMGPRPDSDVVVVVDQVDAETRAWDEHKVMLGFRNRKSALDHYVLGFSDGKGKDRLGGHKIMTVAEFKEWLESGDLKKPVSGLRAAKPAEPAPAPEKPARRRTAPPEGSAEVQSLDRYSVGDEVEVPGRTIGTSRIKSLWTMQSPVGLGLMKKAEIEEIATGKLLDVLLLEIQPVAAPQPEPTPAPLVQAAVEAPAGGAARPATGGAVPSISDMFDQAFDEILGAESDPAAAPAPQGDAETAWDSADDPQRERFLVRGGMSEDAARRYVGRDWSALTKTAQAAVETAISGAEATPKAPRAPRAPSAPRAPRTASAAAASAVKNTAMGVADVVSGLNALFGDKNKLSSGFTFDNETYQKAKPLFIAAARQFGQAGQDIMDVVRALVRGLAAQGLQREAQTAMRPYLEKFVGDVQSGIVDLFPTEGQEDNGTDGANGRLGDPPVSGDRDGDGSAEGDAGGDGPDRALDAEQTEDGGTPETGRGPGSDGARPDAGASAGNGPADGSGDADAGREPGGSGELADDGAGNLNPLPPATRPNYRLENPEMIVGGGPKARFKRNRDAITTLADLQVDNLDPTPEELDLLASYMGWGSFGQELFNGSWEHPRPKPDWAAESAWLRDHLGEAGWKSAQSSIINAHYTDPPTVTALWDAIRAMGFQGGRVLEPSMGIGNFFGLMPADLASASDLTGIELDRTTGAMAKILYPQANISIKGYEESRTADGFYDLVIGNWPFAKQSPPDRRYDRLSPSLHDYFFLKALDQTRAGGLVVGITSSGTMDKQARATRLELAKKADLVAAFRLPTGAFKNYAGTAVVTDVLIFRKRETPNAEPGLEPWIETADMNTASGTIHVNRYYVANPSNVLGQLAFGSGTTFGRAGMIVNRPDNFEELLSGLASRVPADAYVPRAPKREPRFVANNTEDRHNSIVRGPGKDKGFYVVQGERLVALEDLTKYRVKDVKRTARREDQIGRLVDMRRAYGALIDAEREGAPDTEAKRKALRAIHTAFVKEHGPVTKAEGLGYFRDVNDPSWAMLKALESMDGKPAKVLKESSTRSARRMDKPSVRDAYVMQRNESTIIDMARIASLASTTEAEAEAELRNAGVVYRLPGGGYQAADVFLSGNVRNKLHAAEDAQAAGQDMTAEIAALKGAMPSSVPYFQIEARLGAPWVKPPMYRQFIAEMIGAKSSEGIDVFMAGGLWKVKMTSQLRDRPEARSGYGSPHYRFDKMMTAAMGNQSVKIWGKDQDGNDVLLEKATEDVNASIQRIREYFQDWVWADAERKVALEEYYNEVMRAVADPKFDGDFLEFPGMALMRGDSPFELRKHQRDAIWRGVVQEAGLYAHEVGTGKTYTIAGIAIESRRYGRANKPLVLAHNANSASVAADAQRMYPGAKILFIDNLTPAEIPVAVRRIAADDWDMIVMPHSLIDRIGFRRETLEGFAAEEIAALEQEAMAAANDDNVSLSIADMDDPDAMKRVRSQTAKELVKARNAIKSRIDKSANRASREGAIPFEDLGIDMILVDEAHEFKKPPIATRMKIKGLNVSPSDRSISLKFITDYVKSKRNGKGVHLFTGTPITNTLNETFNMMRYIMSEDMKRDGFEHWDAWFASFADAVTDVELTSSGEVDAVTRLSQFVNVADLRRIMGNYLDVVFADDMPEFKPRETSTGKNASAEDLTAAERDEILNGRKTPETAIGRPYKVVRNEVAEMSPAQRQVLAQVGAWAREWRTAGAKQRRNWMLGGAYQSPVVHDNIAAKASMDARLWDMDLPDYPNSKTNRAIANILTHYQESKDGTQVVFMETGYSSMAERTQRGPDGMALRDPATGQTVKAMEPTINLAAEMKAKLVASGIPESEIVIVAGGVKPERKAEIADMMNASKVRVVIGMTGTLGVGVNMQVNLRAMHHIDAPWMPGDLEQRNGRGQRQGNTWNTVFEYRYITEGIDGRRWQVLAIKDRFIKAFFRSDDTVRIIEGDALDMDEATDANSIASSLSEAAGDPRIQQRAKIKADVEKLERRERQHTGGAADAARQARRQREVAEELSAELSEWKPHIADLRAYLETKAFAATIDGKDFTDRKEATEAFAAMIAPLADKLPSTPVVIGTVQGFEVKAEKAEAGLGVNRYHFLQVSVSKGPMTQQLGTNSLPAAEMAIRGMLTRYDNGLAKKAEALGAADRLTAQSQLPFGQAQALIEKSKRLKQLEIDLILNPAPPPLWLRQSSPVQTLIYVKGKPLEVTGHRWTETGYFIQTDKGDVPYLDAKDEAGMPLYEARPFTSPVVGGAARTVPVGPVNLTFVADGSTVAYQNPDNNRAFRDDYAARSAFVQHVETAVEGGARENVKDDTNTLSFDSKDLRDAWLNGWSKKQGLPPIMGDRAAYVAPDDEVPPAPRRKKTFEMRIEDDGGPAAKESRMFAPAPVPATDMKRLANAVAAEIRQAGLEGRITPILVRNLLNVAGVPIAGRQQGAEITVSAASGDVVGVMRHEIIHALRDPKLWDKPYGLFAEQEWKALVRAARSDRALMARVDAAYPDLPTAAKTEEAVAEMYRQWAAGREIEGPVLRILGKIRRFLRAMAAALRGQGFVDAALVMEKISRGEVGSRGPDGPQGPSGKAKDGRPPAAIAEPKEMRLDLLRGRTKAIVGQQWKKTEGSYWSDMLTTAMAGSGGWNTLALVPGRALFAELGKNLLAAKAYLRGKEEMDALRNQWHARADETAQEWMTLRRKDPRANDELMDLMHQTTLDGIDPSKPDTWQHAMAGPAERNIERLGDKADQWAIDTMKQVRQRRATYATLKERFDAMPKPFQAMYRKVRSEYDAIATDFEKAVIENIATGMEIATKRAERTYLREMERIRDEGLEGDEKKAAEATAKEKLDATKQRGGWAGKARMAALRQSFESNRLKGPYFPLARFGEFFVTERDSKGAVVSFSRFETAREQRDYAAEAEARNPGRVQTGVMSNKDELKGSVDPRFVADVEAMLSEAGAGPDVMDAVWQRWLETLPDRSIRNSRIHRKGREGFSKDAFRAFGKHMFHGAHQLAKLKYGLILEEHLNDAEDEARRAEDPSRAGLVVNEMRRRHDFTMNPTGSAAVASLSSLAFIWYLGATPAAAIANVSQTTVVGVPVMAARFQKAGVTGVVRALTRAARDFAQGRGSIENAKDLTADEVLAIKEALRRGTIDKTQAHDLASVAETGIEYNAVREKVMRLIGFFFHHAERFNREVTFMASYRLARAEGMSHADAIDAGADTTWTAHFDYQNCVDGETECLTVEGWKRWDALREGDRIISTDDDGRAVEIGVQAVNVFHRPQQIALFKGKGPRRFSMAVTDNHKCVAMKESKAGGVRGWTVPHFIEAQQLDQRHHLLRAPLTTIDRPDTIGRDMAALIGWFAAEGWYARNRGAKEKNNVRIEQSMVKNPEHVAEIDGILARLGGGFSRQMVKGGKHVLWSLSGDLAKAVQRAVPDKLLPWSLVATLSAGEMDALLDAFIKGDGNRKASNGCITITQKATTNRQNLDVLQAMATVLGKTASLGESGTRDMVWLTMPGTGKVQTRKTAVRHLEQERVSVPMVWCPTTDNGRWIARRNGCVFVTGNTSRPRIAQSDVGKILTTFRNFTINMLWRLFRDTHQALTGATAAERKEARTHLIGITLSMFAHAGIKGVWGYGLLMMLLGIFFPGGSDEAEEKLQDALLLEGDGVGTAAWNWIMGAALSGIPGHVTGSDLTERIGMPNLWFRGVNRDLEGEDLYAHYVGEVLGPVFGIGEGIFRGVSMMADGEIWRGAEAAIPKVVRDLMKSYRFATDGAETLRGDPIIEEMSPWQIILQMNGFTPAQLAERYEINNRLKNEEARIMDERKSIHRAVGDTLRAGEPVSQTLLDRIRDFNARFPEYPITATTIKQSVQGQIRSSERNEFGIVLNPRLNDRLRSELAPSIYN